jgi:hypothetical protein
MMKLHKIADQEEGWLHVVQSMIDVIPMDDSLGPATIILLLDDCPLPTKETVVKLAQVFDLDSDKSKEGRSKPNEHRNIVIVLGCIAEKLAGPRSVALFTPGTLEYLLANMVRKQIYFCIGMDRLNCEGAGSDSGTNNKKVNELQIQSWQFSTFLMRSSGFCSSSALLDFPKSQFY